jgi:hypothetical protein
MTASSFRLGLVSDLHLENTPDFVLDTSNLDVLAALGDILSGEVESATGVDYLAQAAPHIPTLYVPGNHEFEGGTIDQGLARLRKRAKGTKVKVLYRDAVDLFGVRFLGATLWASFDLFGVENRTKCQQEAQKHLHDFKTILAKNGRPFTPAMVRAEHAKDLAWLTAQLAKDPKIPKVLLTHFAPATGSLLRSYGNDPLSAYWVNPCENLVKQAMVSMHGHVHASFDYRLSAAPEGRGRVLANAKGFKYTVRRTDAAEDAQHLLLEQFPDLAHQDEVNVEENPDFLNPLRLELFPATGQVERLA